MLYLKIAHKGTSRAGVLLLAPVLALSACASMEKIPANVSGWAGRVARPESGLPKSCAGWQKIELKGHSRYLLMQKDQKLLMNIDAHNLRGRDIGCWN